MRTRAKRPHLSGLLCATLGLAACASSRQNIEYFTLSVPMPPGKDVQAEGAVLVSRFWARDPYGQSRMIYRVSPYHLDYYNYRLWASAPPEQVQEWTARYLRSAGLFSRVATIPEAGGDLELGGIIRRFEEVDNEAAQTWDAALSVDFWLIRRSERQTVWYGSYDVTRRAPKRNPQAVAEAMSGCLSDVLQRMTAELTPVVRRGDADREAGPPTPAELRHGPAEIRPAAQPLPPKL